VIHPQAVVNPEVSLGANVHVGAFAVLGPGVEVGDDTWIGPHVVINGPTLIGKRNKIFQFSSIGDAPQHLGYAGEHTRLEIGDDNIIREYCTFNRGTNAGGGVTRIGHDNFFMAYCHVAHDCAIGDHTIFANCASLAGHVRVGNYAFLGGFTVVHQFCRIGAHCLTALGTVTFKDIPPYIMAASNPAKPHGLNTRGLKRREFSDAAIDTLRQAYKLVYKSGLRLKDALAELDVLAGRSQEVDLFATFISNSERGIIR
jgi:UDP-N-acetylglucosamine acyltransferase